MMYNHVQIRHEKETAVWLFLLGISLIPSIFISLDFAAEMTFPLNGTISTGIIMISGHCWSLLFTTVCEILIDKEGIHGCQVSFQIMAVGSLVALILSAFIKPELKRSESEIDANSE
jgi:FLVCR family feline leukemia virus subgroup C receptor-related protein